MATFLKLRMIFIIYPPLPRLSSHPTRCFEWGVCVATLDDRFWTLWMIDHFEVSNFESGWR